MGFMIAEDSPMIWRGPMVMGAIEQMVRDTKWNHGGDIDIMVVDLPPGTGDAQLSLSQKVSLDGAVVICTPQDLALLDAVRGANMFRKVGVPILGLVENMSKFICPNCSHETHIFGHEGVKKTAERMSLPFLGDVPLHMSIRETSDEGRPISISQPKSESAMAYDRIAKLILQKLESEEHQKSQSGPKISIE